MNKYFIGIILMLVLVCLLFYFFPMTQDPIPQNLIDQYYTDPIIAKICRESGPLPGQSDNRLGWHARLVFVYKNESGEIGGYFHERVAGVPDDSMVYLNKSGELITDLAAIDQLKKDFPVIDKDGCLAPNRMI